MRSFFTKLRKLFTAGVLFMLPVFVIFIILTKVWTALTSVSTKIAAMFAMKTIMGIGGASIYAGVLLILICLLCGFLVRLSFMNAFNKMVERSLSKYIPGYATYKAMAEEKLQNKAKQLPYTSALLMHSGFWQPVYITEQDQEDNYVVFLPEIPDTTKGHLLLAKKDQLKLIPSLTANELDASIKLMGKGLLTEHHVIASGEISKTVASVKSIS